MTLNNITEVLRDSRGGQSSTGCISFSSTGSFSPLFFLSLIISTSFVLLPLQRFNTPSLSSCIFLAVIFSFLCLNQTRFGHPHEKKNNNK